jgi:DNA replication protein DnaC
MAATKRSSAPGEADKLIAHQARLLKAPRIAAHYHRLAEQGRQSGWSLEDYLGAVLAVESNARAESGARQRIRYAGFPAIKTITDFDFTAQPTLDRAQIARLEAGGWLAEARNIVLLGPGVIAGFRRNWMCLCCSARCCDRFDVVRAGD